MRRFPWGWCALTCVLGVLAADLGFILACLLFPELWLG